MKNPMADIAKIEYSWTDKTRLELKLQGDYLGYSDDKAKEDLFSQLNLRSLREIKINAKALGKWDSSLVAVIYNLVKISKSHNIKLDVSALPEGLKRLIDLAFSVDRKPDSQHHEELSFFENLGQGTLNAYASFKSGISFLADSAGAIGRFFTSKAVMRKVDFYFSLEDCSYRAFAIVALISFMVGLIFGFVGAMQLKIFGAQIYVASLVALAMVRVMGAVMTGIIIAGRTGSSYAATIGTMQVNEEIDALNTMGIPVVDFLLLPRMMALMLMMPLLTVFSDVLGMLGGAFVGIFMLSLSPSEYWDNSLQVLNMKHFLVGLFHGFTFGCIIAICGCYHGLKCGRDADSVGKATTAAVVYSIVWIIVATAVITVFCQVLGI